jgi:dipeptidyl aminopeptidase/acylaminoacyl peptidase
MRKKHGLLAALSIALLSLAPGAAAAFDGSSTGLEQSLAFPFVSDLGASKRGDSIAWVGRQNGVRNIWVASGADFHPRQVTDSRDDDGQELTSLAFSPDGRRIAWVRGGDHDSNWDAEGKLQPDPASAVEQQHLTVWTADVAAGTPREVTEGDAPAITDSGRIAFVREGKAWIAEPGAKPERLFFDRGDVSDLAWSSDGRRLAFVSDRDDHAFIGIYSGKDRPILWLAASTGRDGNPVWSPDGTRIAFTRRPGSGGAPQPLLEEVKQPWSIWVANAETGEGAAVWRSPDTMEVSFTSAPDGPVLRWAAGDRLTFRAEMDGWPHLYSVPASGGEAMLLTPGNYMVEHVALSGDGKWLLYSANTGRTSGDDDRRHIFRVPVDRAAPEALSAGEGLEWTPVPAGSGVAFVSATAKRPPAVHWIGGDRRDERALGASPVYAVTTMVVPKPVTFRASDGLLIHGQLFDASGGKAKKPALIFVHGGPPRQMLLGWSYMYYYSHAYAVNQYLASRGFVVLSVNYRLGIGYGRAFHHPKDAGARGASEYRDVVGAAHFLQTLPQVDAKRIGIWGGSYGGYLTALALARDSDIFKAGVDFHGVHDMSRTLYERHGPPKRYEQGDWDAALKTAFTSSPVADVATWRSPVLLIHGDDDRNVRFHQTVDLARRLDAQGVRYEELIFPNEIHDFLRDQDWLKADQASVQFLERELKP